LEKRKNGVQRQALTAGSLKTSSAKRHVENRNILRVEKFFTIHSGNLASGLPRFFSLFPGYLHFRRALPTEHGSES
jgi:hypothetical protein